MGILRERDLTVGPAVNVSDARASASTLIVVGVDKS